MRSTIWKPVGALVVALVVAAGCSSDASTSNETTAGTTAGTTTGTTADTTADTSDPTDSAAPATGPADSAMSTVGTTPIVTAADSRPPTADSGPPQGSENSVFTSGDVDPALQSYVDVAVADLAERLGADPAGIVVHSAVLVVWPDGSLGCPAAGMQYAQVTTDGALIELAVDGTFFRYHAGGSTRPFICDQPLTDTPETLG